MRIEARGLHNLIKKFGQMPGELQEEMRITVKIAVDGIRKSASEEHEWISRTGKTEREGVSTSVKGLVGVVELTTLNAIGLHQGRPAHVIEPRNKTILRFPVKGKFVFARKVNHPGNKAYPYLFNAAEKERPAIESRFEAAIEKALRQL